MPRQLNNNDPRKKGDITTYEAYNEYLLDRNTDLSDQPLILCVMPTEMYQSILEEAVDKCVETTSFVLRDGARNEINIGYFTESSLLYSCCKGPHLSF